MYDVKSDPLPLFHDLIETCKRLLKGMVAVVSIILLFSTTEAFSPPVAPNHASQFPYQTKLAQSVTMSGKKGAFRLETKMAVLPNALSSSIVRSDDTWGNISTLCSTAVVSQSLGTRTAIGKLLGPPVTAMALAFTFGSIGILPPGGSPGAKILQILSIQLATPLLLLGVNIRSCRKSCGPLLVAFILASFGTMIASVAAVPICSSPLQNALGIDGLKIAAALMAKNIGGGLNYVAVCRSLNATPNAVAAGLCVDNIFALIYFPIISALSAGRPDVSSTDVTERKEQIVEDDENVTVEKVSESLALAAMATWLGEMIGGSSAALPLSTLLTIIFTMICPSKARSLKKTGEVIGTTFLYFFFATAGAPGLSIAESVKSAFIPIAMFLSILYGIHGLVLMLVRTIIELNRRKRVSKTEHDPVSPQMLLVASSAAIGGPATAAALAKANGWKSLVEPSLIVGNIGYAIATFAGILFYTIFS